MDLDAEVLCEDWIDLDAEELVQDLTAVLEADDCTLDVLEADWILDWLDCTFDWLDCWILDCDELDACWRLEVLNTLLLCNKIMRLFGHFD